METVAIILFLLGMLGFIFGIVNTIGWEKFYWRLYLRESFLFGLVCVAISLIILNW